MVGPAEVVLLAAAATGVPRLRCSVEHVKTRVNALSTLQRARDTRVPSLRASDAGIA
jgi:hypothetical protein